MHWKVEAGASSFPEWSFSPFFERTWASVYEALEDGQIDAEGLRKVFVDFAPPRAILSRRRRTWRINWVCPAHIPRQ